MVFIGDLHTTFSVENDFFIHDFLKNVVPVMLHAFYIFIRLIVLSFPINTLLQFPWFIGLILSLFGREEALCIDA